MSKSLLVIDVQNDYFIGGNFPLWNTEAVLANTLLAIEAAKAKGVPVIIIKHIADKSHGLAPFFNEGTSGVEVHSAISAAAPDAAVVIKSFADSFHQEGVIVRTTKIRHPQHYVDAVQEGKSVGSRAIIETKDLPFEFLMNALRLRSGFSIGLFAQRTGLSMEVLEPTLSDLKEEGLLEQSQEEIRCTSSGFNFLDTILQRFLP